MGDWFPECQAVELGRVLLAGCRPSCHSNSSPAESDQAASGTVLLRKDAAF